MASSSEASEAFKQGIKIRREVLGDAYVDKALAGVKTAPFVASRRKLCYGSI
jgi:hypothetical protein